MTDIARRAARLALAALLAVTAASGCGGGDGSGEVSGTVTVDGQVPAEGSSITFVPTGKTTGGGGPITGGKYAVKLAAGDYKVEIRAPEAAQGGKAPKADGPGPGGVGLIKESLPAKYNDRTELTCTVKPGAQEKNWELTK